MITEIPREAKVRDVNNLLNRLIDQHDVGPPHKFMLTRHCTAEPECIVTCQLRVQALLEHRFRYINRLRPINQSSCVRLSTGVVRIIEAWMPKGSSTRELIYPNREG